MSNVATSPPVDRPPSVAGRLSGRVVLVIGAGASGPGWSNGKAAAVVYARAGATVVAVDVSGDAACETADIIRAEGFEATALQADATDEPSVSALIARVHDTHGRIDVLHNNVGTGDLTALHELSVERWNRMLSINLTTAFLATKHAVPVMRAQGRGVITNISSVASLGVNAYPYVGYYASKAGLNHLTRATAIAYAHEGIRCNAVLPGLIDTPLVRYGVGLDKHHGGEEALLRARDAMSPTGKQGTPWDVAYASLFLASDEAAYVNGVILPVDGGLSCRIGS